MKRELLAALRGMNVVTCTYKDHPRRVHPLVLLLNEDDELVLACWQVEGGSGSERVPPFWDHFALSEITDLTVLAETFPKTPRGYNPGRYSRIVYAVPKTRPA